MNAGGDTELVGNTVQDAAQSKIRRRCLLMKARIKFRKYGALRFIGHLDVMRFFQKVMRRLKLPIAFTGGYSPHMIMSFCESSWNRTDK